jgi:hypothetical protein
MARIKKSSGKCLVTALVSNNFVITYTHNACSLLQRSIRTLRLQSIKNAEIVIDGGRGGILYTVELHISGH